MTWKTPKIVEVPVGMEINMYACAACLFSRLFCLVLSVICQTCSSVIREAQAWQT